MSKAQPLAHATKALNLAEYLGIAGPPCYVLYVFAVAVKELYTNLNEFLVSEL